MYQMKDAYFNMVITKSELDSSLKNLRADFEGKKTELLDYHDIPSPQIDSEEVREFDAVVKGLMATELSYGTLYADHKGIKKHS